MSGEQRSEVSAHEFEDRKGAEANQCRKGHHRWRKPQYLPIPSPAEGEEPISGGRDPHEGQQRYEQSEDDVDGFLLSVEELLIAHAANIPSRAILRNGADRRFQLWYRSGC